MKKLSVGVALLAVGNLFFLFFYLWLPNRSMDIYFLLRQGKDIVAKGALPLIDTYSYGDTLKPILAGQWLSAVLFHLVYEHASFKGLFLLKGLVGISILGLLSRLPLASPVSRSVRLAALTLLAVLLYNYLNLRGLLFTLFFVALYLYWFYRYGTELSLRNLLFFTVTLIAWGNLHGGKIVAPFLFLLVVCSQHFQGRQRLRDLWFIFLTIGVFYFTALLGIGGTVFGILFLLAPWLASKLLIGLIALFLVLSVAKYSVGFFSVLCMLLLFFLYWIVRIFLKYRGTTRAEVSRAISLRWLRLVQWARQKRVFIFLAIGIIALSTLSFGHLPDQVIKTIIVAFFLLLWLQLAPSFSPKQRTRISVTAIFVFLMLIGQNSNPNGFRNISLAAHQKPEGPRFELPLPMISTSSVGRSLSYLSEWHGAELRQPFFSVLYAALFLQLFPLFFYWRKLDSQTKVFALAAFPLPFLARRHFPLSFLLLYPLLVQSLSFLFSQRRVLVLSFSLCGAFLALLFPYRWVFPLEVWNLHRFQQKYIPLDAVRFIQMNRLPPRVFNELSWGGVLLSSLYPDYKVAIDGRYGEVYTTEYIHRYVAALRGRKAQAFLKAYKVHTVIVDVRRGIYSALQRDPKWHKIYEDAQAAIFVDRRWKKKFRYPQSDLYYLVQGLFAEARHSPEQALTFYKKSLKIAPCSSEALEAIVLLSLKQGDYQRGLAMLKTALDCHPLLLIGNRSLSRALARSPISDQVKWRRSLSLASRFRSALKSIHNPTPISER